MDSNLQESIIQKQQEMLNELKAKLDIAVEALKEIYQKNFCEMLTGTFPVFRNYSDVLMIASKALEKLSVK